MYVGEGRVRDAPAPLMPVWKVASLSLVFGIVVCAHTYTICMYCTINCMLLGFFCTQRVFVTSTSVVLSYSYTVEPPNHIGDEHFVRGCPFFEGITVWTGGKQCVHCREAFHSLECPLSEVSLCYVLA